MATKVGPRKKTVANVTEIRRPASSPTAWDSVVAFLAPLASLRLTVVLFAMSIFIVFAGTLAQTEKDIWQVVHDYFRMDLRSPAAAMGSAFSWIDFRIFFPRSFFPEMQEIPWGYGFFFPSGWLIGFLLFLNLSAAHLIRFRIQTRGARLISGLGILVAGGLLTALVIAAGSEQTASQLKLFADWPSLRILWLLTQCTVVSVVLLVGCGLVFRKRAGIVLLHAGVGLLMFGELLVGIAAVEGQMQLVEGETVNFVMDTREVELAAIDTSGQATDEVVAVPQSLLRRGNVIRDDSLPFDVELVEYLPNSVLRPAVPGVENPATTGAGLRQIALPVAAISGTDNTGRVNSPAAYVRLFRKGTEDPLGVYLVGFNQWRSGQPEKIQVGDKTYDLYLRSKHMYKPYSMHLVDVKHDRYMGTQTAKSYSSELRLLDPSRNVDRVVKIWMNNPLRFAGETFYQSNYGQDPRTGLEYTGLQVVTNTGWRIPYVSCMMVVVGMLAQFSISLRRFLKRRESGRLDAEDGDSLAWPTEARDRRSGPSETRPESPREPAKSPPGSRSRAGWLVPMIVVVTAGLWVASKSYERPVKEGKADLAAFGRLPVMYEGRVKPFDTLARNSLRILSDKQTFTDENNIRQPAIRWLLDVITDAQAAQKHRVFRIQSLEVLDALGLERRQGFRYSIEDFLPKINVFEQQASIARQTAPEQRDLFAKKILELDQKLHLYMILRESFRMPVLRPDSLSEDLSNEASRREQYASASLPLAVPPVSGAVAPGGGADSAGKKGTGDDSWQPFTFAVFDAVAQRMAAAQGMKVADPNPATVGLLNILTAYESKTAGGDGFNQSVAEYRTLLESHPPAQWNVAKTDFEAFFNHFSPLFYAMILYIFAFVLGCFSWLGWSVPLRRAATWLTLFTFVVHTLALMGRMYISGRPPITNLYSSAIFIGWACVLLGLILERYSKIGVANVIAAFAGFATLLIAFLMTTAVPSFKGDSFTVLVAVLDTQFWLATHVTCVTAGYSATFVAGLLGIVYVLRGVLTPSLSAGVAKNISRMIYGTVCFAIFFSFFGTVLGGLWADDSWGRFWGWDPKENGALIIVLWNAIVLHAHWGRMVGERGLAVLAIVGNIVTSWSWFGVNELGVGLHSYGFTEGVLMILGMVVAGHLLIIFAGLLPTNWWWSRKLG